VVFSQKFLLHFSPQEWTAAERLRYFVGPPFRRDLPMLKGLSAVRSHLKKFALLSQIAYHVIPQLPEDDRQLENEGYTQAMGASVSRP
jgi:hypothetical protein